MNMPNYANCLICGNLTDDGQIHISGKSKNRRYGLICFDCLERFAQDEIEEKARKKIEERK